MLIGSICSKRNNKMKSNKSDDEMKYALSASVNVGNFVNVKPSLGEYGDERRRSFKIWEEQMMCLLGSQGMVGFVDGEIEPPSQEASEQCSEEWRRRDRLVKGWILGSIGRDALDSVWKEPTARAAWLALHHIFQENSDQRSTLNSDQRMIDTGIQINELVCGGGAEDYSMYLAVYKAAQRGDWDTAMHFFSDDISRLSTTIINSDSETALHVSVLAGRHHFMSKVVETAPAEALAIKDSAGRTALHNAAIVGNKEVASALVRKNPDLLHIPSYSGRLPVLEAAINCQKQTLMYLIAEHGSLLFEGQYGIQLLNEIIASQYFDIALDLVLKHPNLTLPTDQDDGRSALPTLIAATYSLFQSIYTLSSSQKFIYHNIPLEAHPPHTTSLAPDIESLTRDGVAHKNYISPVMQKLEHMIWNIIEIIMPQVKELKEKKAMHRQALQLAEYLCNRVSQLPEAEASEIFNISIIEAAKYDVSEIAEMIIDKKPSVIFHGDPATGRNVFMIAVACRNENVFNLIYNMSDRRCMFVDSTDNEGNNLMHICGKLAPPHRLTLVSGAALQMQREILWFMEMERFVNPSRRTWVNEQLQTPEMVFTQEHKNLRAEGETWMKETCNACTIAATLIATVMFAAAFTVPGGLESTTGIPLFAGQTAFNIFVVSDTISLFTSIASLLMFLSIVTSRYAEADFLYLTKRLSVVMISLFMSIMSMLVAFSATLYLVPYANVKTTWFVVALTAGACLPVTSFTLVQFPLLVEVVSSNYGRGIFEKRSNRFLY